jgi:hypothetical protein
VAVHPQTDKHPWQQARNVLLIVLLVLLVALAMLALRGSQFPAAVPSGETQLAVILAPFLALAVAIERFWETVFDWYESLVMGTAKLVGVSAETATWMNKELENAQTAVQALTLELASAATPNAANAQTHQALLDTFHEAEKRLKDAQSRIAETVKAPQYVGTKRAITLLGSLVLGVFISTTANLTLLNAAGIPIAIAADVLVTGLLIGSGPGPLHQFISILEELRSAAAGLSGLANGAAFLKAKEALVTATNDAQDGQRTLTPTEERIVRDIKQRR